MRQKMERKAKEMESYMMYIKMNINLAFAPEGRHDNSPGQAQRSPGKGQQKTESPAGAREMAAQILTGRSSVAPTGLIDFHLAFPGLRPLRRTCPGLLSTAPSGSNLPVKWISIVLLLLACLAGGVAQAQTLSFTPGMVSALTTANSTTGSAANYTGPLSDLVLNEPQALTYDSQGDLFIVDAGANVVRVVAGPYGTAIPSLPSVPNPTPGDVYTVAGSGNSTASSDPLCSTDELTYVNDSFNYSDSTSYYGNGCPAADAILNFTNLFGYVGSGSDQTQAPTGQVAIDSNGNLYIADEGDLLVRVVYAGGTVPGLQTSLPTDVTPTAGYIYAFTQENQSTKSSETDTLPPVGVAIDASGDVYILYNSSSDNRYDSTLGVISNGGSLPNTLAGTTLTTGQYANLAPLGYYGKQPPWHYPAAITLDSSGNIYISEANGNILGSVFVIYAGGTVPGLSVTLNGATPVVGDAYTFAGNSTSRPAKSAMPAYPPGVTATSVTTDNPTQLYFDSAGDLYMGLRYGYWYAGSFMAKVDTSGDLALVAGNLTLLDNQGKGTQAVCAAAADNFGDGCPANQVAMIGPWGVAAAPDGSVDYVDAYKDSNSNVYYALHKIDGSASEEQFSTETAGVASSAQIVAISNVSTETLTLSAINFPNNFTQVTSGGTDCTASTSLTAGQSCMVGIQFQAVEAGSFSGNVTITSNSTNATSGTNSIAVSGTATAATGTSAQSIKGFSLPTTVTYGQTCTLSATADSGLTVLYQVTSGPAKISGSTLTVTGLGAITVTAYQPGDNGDSSNSSGWAAATSVAAKTTAQAATLTFTADNKDQTPGYAIPTLTYTVTGLASWDTQATVTTGAPDITTTATSSSSTGDYPITITQGTLALTTSNYTLAFVNGTFTIDARLAQTITFTQTFSTVTYGASPITLSASASSGLAITWVVTGPATVSNSILTITGAGTVTVTATQPGDVTYAPAPNSATQSFDVQQAPLTFTADNKTMAYGSPVPTLTYTLSGLVNGETAATVVSNTPTLTTTATSSSAVGTYSITITQALVTVSSNYTINSSSFVNGTLTVITGTAQTVTFNSLPNVTYGVAAFALSASSDSGLTVTYTVSGPASLANNVLSVTGAGTVTVTASQAGNATYNPAKSVSQSFTVAKAAMTITADNKTRVNNTWNPTLTYTITGLVNGDTAAVLNGGPSISTTATASSPAGDYPITLASVTNENGTYPSATNYTITLVSGTLTVTSGGPAQSFNMTLSSQSLSIVDGSVGQVTLTIAPVNYYNGKLNLSCTGLPANASCIFSPSPLNVTLYYSSSVTETPNSTQGTLTISTSNAPVVGSLRSSGKGIYSAAIAGWASLLFGLVLAWQRKRLARYKTIWVLAMAVSLLGMAASLTACGGTSTSYSFASPGTSTIQVIAADSNGGPSNSTSLAITIQ
jgi:hypothetical protein